MKRNHKWVTLMNTLQWGNIDHWDKFPNAAFSDNMLQCKEWVRSQLEYMEEEVRTQFNNYFFLDAAILKNQYPLKDVGVSIIRALYKKEHDK